MDSQSTDRFNAISGKLDIVLTRQLNQQQKFSDILARLAHLESRPGVKPDHRTLKLGKRAPWHDSRTLRLADYLKAGLPAPPSMIDWTAGLSSWGMMLNDQLGDCTIAAVGHAIQAWTACAGSELTLPDWVILDYYEAWDGYIAGDPASDQGGVEVDVLNQWRKYGFGLRADREGSCPLYAYCDPDPGDVAHVKQAISLFGGVYIGLALPLSAQNQAVWDVVGDGRTGNSAPGSWGGHAVWVPKYTPARLTCVTWGGLQDMTWAFWKAYVDESHALLSPQFLKNGEAPSGFNLAALQTDLALVTA
jgi:hypothetical protein